MERFNMHWTTRTAHRQRTTFGLPMRCVNDKVGPCCDAGVIAPLGWRFSSQRCRLVRSPAGNVVAVPNGSGIVYPLRMAFGTTDIEPADAQALRRSRASFSVFRRRFLQILRRQEDAPQAATQQPHIRCDERVCTPQTSLNCKICFLCVIPLPFRFHRETLSMEGTIVPLKEMMPPKPWRADVFARFSLDGGGFLR